MAFAAWRSVACRWPGVAYYGQGLLNHRQQRCQASKGSKNGQIIHESDAKTKNPLIGELSGSACEHENKAESKEERAKDIPLARQEP